MSLFRDYSTMMKRGGENDGGGGGSGRDRSRASRGDVRGGVGNPGARGGQTGDRHGGGARGGRGNDRGMQGAPAGVGSVDTGFSDNQRDVQAAAGDPRGTSRGGRDPLGGTDRAGRGDTLGGSRGPQVGAQAQTQQATLGASAFPGSGPEDSLDSGARLGGTREAAAAEATENRQRAGADVGEEQRSQGNGVVARQIGTGDVIRSGGASGVGNVVRPGLRPSDTPRSRATGRSRGAGASRAYQGRSNRRRVDDE